MAQVPADATPPAGWHLVLDEEFNQPSDSSALAARWRFSYPWGRNLGGLETEYYTGNEVAVRGGSLLLTAHRLSQPRAYQHGHEQLNLGYTSGMVYGRHPTRDSLRPAPCPPGEGLSYGWFEMRCRLPRDAGSFPAFWLYGPPDELDIVEANPTSISNNVHLHAHDYWRPGPVEESECQCTYYWPGTAPLPAAYHRYALQWLPGELTFYFDGVPIRRENRFLPLGCAQAVIANLAEWAWSGVRTDTLAIDYIRIYQPQMLPPAAFGSRAAAPPRPGFLNFPKAIAPERSSPLGQQTWELVQPATGKMALVLRDNFNPMCASRLPLPLGPGWQGSWQLGWRATPIALRISDAEPVHWAILNTQGQLLRQGECSPGMWEPPLAELPAGAYQLRLRAGAAVGYQALYVVLQPANSQPTSEWLRLLPPI